MESKRGTSHDLPEDWDFKSLLLLKLLGKQTAHLLNHCKHTTQTERERETRSNQVCGMRMPPQFVMTYKKTGTLNQEERNLTTPRRQRQSNKDCGMLTVNTP